MKVFFFNYENKYIEIVYIKRSARAVVIISPVNWYFLLIFFSTEFIKAEIPPINISIQIISSELMSPYAFLPFPSQKKSNKFINASLTTAPTTAPF